MVENISSGSCVREFNSWIEHLFLLFLTAACSVALTGPAHSDTASCAKARRFDASERQLGGLPLYVLLGGMYRSETHWRHH